MKRFVSLILTLALSLGMMASMMVESSAASSSRIPKKAVASGELNGPGAGQSTCTVKFSYSSSSKTLTVDAGDYVMPADFMMYSTKVARQNNAILCSSDHIDCSLAMSDLVCNGTIKKIVINGSSYTQTITFTVDSDKKLCTKSEFDGATTTYTYNSNKQLTKVTTSSGSKTFSYSSSRITSSDGKTYTLNSDGRITKMNPNNQSNYYEEYSYTKKGRIKSIYHANSQMGTVKYTYNDSGKLATVTGPYDTITYTY